MGITLGIITKNEEKNIKDCIMSAKDIVDDIVVIDDCSTDNTIKIAQALGARVIIRKLDSFSGQKNYLLEQAGGEWVLVIDADERVDEDLRSEIRKSIPNTDCSGFLILRNNIFFGKDSNAHDWILRLVKRGSAQFENPVHEALKIKGKVGKLLKGRIIHYSTPDLTTYLRKLDKYVNLKSEENRGKSFLGFRMVLAPPCMFLWLYIFKLGFLDGFVGFLYSVLAAFNLFLDYAMAIQKNRESAQNKKPF